MHRSSENNEFARRRACFVSWALFDGVNARSGIVIHLASRKMRKACSDRKEDEPFL